MTVQELRDKLDALVAAGKGNLQVKTEGCDCDGWAGGVDVYGECAYINRDLDPQFERAEEK